MVPELFIDMARSLEPACFDYLLIEDSSYVGESFAGSTELYLKHGIAVPQQDPSVVASLMSQATSRIGIVPTFGTFASAPREAARNRCGLPPASDRCVRFPGLGLKRTPSVSAPERLNCRYPAQTICSRTIQPPFDLSAIPVRHTCPPPRSSNAPYSPAVLARVSVR
jgi:hypothetical protein